MEPTLTVTVVNIVPTAGYDDQVYEQSVDVDLQNGQRLRLFDGITILDPGLEGSIKEIVVLASPRTDGIQVLDEQVKGIREPEEPISEWSYVFTGNVLQEEIQDVWFKEPNDLLLLDVGTGSIVVEVNSRLRGLMKKGEVTKGDVIEVEASRTDIIGVKGS